MDMANLMIKCIRGYINQQSYIEEVADAANAQLLPKFDYIKIILFLLYSDRTLLSQKRTLAG